MVAASAKTNSLRSPRAFTLIELLVVVSIIALLVAILVPALNEARSVAKRAVCATNIHGLLLAVNSYYSDYNEIPNHSAYWPTSTNYHAWAPGQHDAVDALEMTTGDFTAIYPAYVNTPDAFYCPDGPHSAEGSFVFYQPLHPVKGSDIMGLMGFYMTYSYYGNALPDGFGRNPAKDINGDVTEIPASLLASPDAVLINDWSWYSSPHDLYAATNHPAYAGSDDSWLNAPLPGRDGLNNGHVDGSVVWVNDSDTIPRYYRQGFWWQSW